MSSISSSVRSDAIDFKRLIFLGAVGGAVGGMVMAMMAMLIAIGYDGFWTPVRGITSVAFGDQHYGSGFAFGPVAIGVIGHMVNSMMFGMLFAIVAGTVLSTLKPAAVVLMGLVYGIMLWVIMVVVVADGLQSTGLFVDALPQWAWLAVHMLFGAVAAGILAAGNARPNAQ